MESRKISRFFFASLKNIHPKNQKKFKKICEKIFAKKNCLCAAARRTASPPPRPRCRGARIRSPRAAAVADPGLPERGGGARCRGAPLHPLRRRRSRSPPPRRSPPSAPPSPLAVPAVAARGPRHRAARLGWGRRSSRPGIVRFKGRVKKIEKKRKGRGREWVGPRASMRG